MMRTSFVDSIDSMKVAYFLLLTDGEFGIMKVKR